MMARLKNTPDSFGAISKGFHWLIALIVIGMLALGLYMDAQEPSPSVFKLYQWHKSFGIVVLLLVSLRLIWRISSVWPRSVPTHKKIEKTAAHITHFLLYAALFAMPISGWLMSSAANSGVVPFGLFEMPHLIAADQATLQLMKQMHGLIAYGLMGLIALHLGGALKHHFIDKDETLLRMLPFCKGKTQ